ncbi:MAG: cation diffusion facilitator family transporter [Gammaproteobacteria bacterium]|nr:cation diffusion facilitator family transporter [Gammaproteobacteria bacterium]
MTGCGCEFEITRQEQQKVLWWLLLINAVMFVVELITGVIADSTGLIADSLDMLADATVYGIALYAVGHSAIAKTRAAHLSGVFQIVLAIGIFADVLRRWMMGSEPQSDLIILISLFALAANVLCLKLISKHRNGEVHMRASWIFSKNDVLANLGVILSGVLIYLSGSRWPDLIIGAVITLLVLRGGMSIVKDAKAEKLKIISA